MRPGYRLFTDRDIAPRELARLFAAVGWGTEMEYSLEKIRTSIKSHSFVAYIRDEHHRLVGYVSVFTDGAFSVVLNELVVDPEHQGRGLGRALLQAVEKAFPGLPIYVMAFESSAAFFARQGYALPHRPMLVMTKTSKNQGSG